MSKKESVRNLTIVIASHSRIDTLSILLDQIQNQKLDEEIKVNIIVVLDESSNSNRYQLDEVYPNITVVQGTGNWWWTKSMNEGFKRAILSGCSHVLILNDDNQISQDFILKLFTDFKSIRDENCILGCISVEKNTPNVILSSGSLDFNRTILRFKRYHSTNKCYDDDVRGIFKTWNLSGRGTLIPVSVFSKVGFYDEKLVQYGSDDEYILRAIRNGINCYITWNVAVYTDGQMTSEGSPYRNDGFIKFIKSFFIKYSINSIFKEKRIYYLYGVKILTPLYLLLFILGTFYAYFIKHKK